MRHVQKSVFPQRPVTACIDNEMVDRDQMRSIAESFVNVVDDCTHDDGSETDIVVTSRVRHATTALSRTKNTVVVLVPTCLESHSVLSRFHRQEPSRTQMLSGPTDTGGFACVSADVRRQRRF